jgi:hypothetical protein
LDEAISTTHGFKPRLGRFDAKQLRLFATLDTAPKLPLGGNDEMLIERISMGDDLHPFAAAGNY